MKNKPPHPNHKDRPLLGQTRPYSLHVKNPAGTKFLRACFRAHQGIRGTREEAVEWCKNYNPERR